MIGLNQFKILAEVGSAYQQHKWTYLDETGADLPPIKAIIRFRTTEQLHPREFC